MFSHVGELASSKSAMKIFAPEFSALITILRSVGPVISTRRSNKSGGIGAQTQLLSRIALVSGKKSSASPRSRAACRTCRFRRHSSRRPPKPRCNFATKPSASCVRISLKAGETSPVYFDARRDSKLRLCSSQPEVNVSYHYNRTTIHKSFGPFSHSPLIFGSSCRANVEGNRSITNRCSYPLAPDGRLRNEANTAFGQSKYSLDLPLTRRHRCVPPQVKLAPGRELFP